MSCGVVSGLSLNLSNITQINADVVEGRRGGCMVIKDIGNINLSSLVFVWVLYTGFMQNILVSKQVMSY